MIFKLKTITIFLVLFLVGCVQGNLESPTEVAFPSLSVSSITPNGGAASGGTIVSITGSNFLSGTTVTIGGVPCTVSSTTSNLITCTTGGNALGTYDVVIMMSDGQSEVLSNAFEYRAPPTVTGISPTNGFEVGGTALTITGTDFLSGATVTVGGNTCTSVTVVSSTTITCLAPAGTGGSTVDVVVTNSDAQSFNFANSYSFDSAPTVTSVAPANGGATVNTAITITGTNFVAGGSLGVTINGVACTSPTVASATSITCITGISAAGTYDVIVTNGDGQPGTLTNGFTYDPAPTVTSISPAAGAVSTPTAVTITGTNFLAGASVTIGGVACTSINVVSTTQITCTSPSLVAGSNNVVVTNADTQSSTLAGGYITRAAPTVASVSPTSGVLAGGGVLTITGTGFDNTLGATVTVGGATCTTPNVISASSITCILPARTAGTYDVVVTNTEDSQSGTGSNLYTYSPAPTLTTLSPTEEALTGGGETLTLTGTNFISGATVSIAGVACTPVTFVGSTQLTCPVPAGTAGIKSVTVTNPDGQVSGTQNFTYRAVPTFTSISPDKGPLGGGQPVTISGSFDATVTSVTINAITCGITSQTSTTVTCNTGTTAAGTYAVQITDTHGQVVTSGSVYEYRGAPTFTSATLNEGPIAGGNTINIVGTNFFTGLSATVGGAACTSITLNSSTDFDCVVPAGTAGAQDIVITNATDNQTVTANNAYTYRAAPTIASVSPAFTAIAGGGTLTINGANFVVNPSITVNGVACVFGTYTSSSQVSCTLPNIGAAGSYDVVLTNPDTQSVTLSGGVTYRVAPTASSISPTIGSTLGGTTLTIFGTNFVSGATVSVGGANCTPVNFVNSTEINCTTPAAGAGTADVVVTNPAPDSQVSNTLSNAFTYALAPTVTSVSPTATDLAGGGTLTITGTNFQNPPSSILVGVTTCASPTYVSATQVTCTLPALTAGSYAVTVTNPDTLQGSLASAITYDTGPTVTSVSPNAGALAGGDMITITGADFVAGATATVGGLSCTSPNVVDANTITCLTPNNPTPNSYDVVVSLPNGLSSTLSNSFTYRTSPTITSITPNEGFSSGGSFVTIVGNDFAAGASVTIGGVACNLTTFVDANTITCITPAGAVGTADVIVTNFPDMQSATGSNIFTYNGAPTVTTITPNIVATVSPASITITGTNFVSGLTVDVNGSACASPVVGGSTTITCTPPVQAEGTYSVIVTNPDTQNVVNTAPGLTYYDAPTVTSVSPLAGDRSGGVSLTINGTDFRAGLNVTVGGSPCTTLTRVSDTELTCVTPPTGAGVQAIIVTNTTSDGGTVTNNSYNALDAATVTAIDVTSGPTAGGTTITFTGTDFYALATASVAGVPCATTTVASSTSLTCVTGASATAASGGAIVSNVTGLDSASFGTFTYVLPPTLSSVSPTAGALAGGTTLTLNGSDFVSVPTSITVGGSACTGIAFLSGSQVTCTLPAMTAGTYDVIVTNPDGQTSTLSNAYTYQGPPSIVSYSPASGTDAGGSTITINGTGFDGSPTVTIATGGCNVTSSTSTQVVCTTTAGTAGVQNLQVVNSDAQTSNTVSYTYLATPTYASVSPTNGPANSTTAITITGTNFTVGTTVTVGGNSCTGLTVVSSTSITCTAPTGTVGAQDIVITDSASQSVTGSGAFTYNAAPTITTLAPIGGPTTGGGTLTITGTNFLNAPTGVTIDGNACTGVTWNSATEVTCTVPAGTNGSKDVVLTNLDGQTVTVIGGYTYQAAPTVTAVSPTVGKATGGDLITITGTNFLSGASVTIGSTACTPVTVVSSTQVTCTLGVEAETTAVAVNVINADTQVGTLATAFTYQDAPTITSFTQTQTNLSGGSLLIINGTNFRSGLTVTVGGDTCTSPSYISANQATCLLPAKAIEGTYNLVLTNTDNQSAVLASGPVYATQTIMSWVNIGGPPYDYGSVAVNTGVTFTLQNTGDKNSASFSVVITGTDPTKFLIGSNTCTGIVSAGANCTVHVIFTAGDGAVASGTYTGIIRATSTDGTFDYNLTGTKP